jgi:BCD family chlorophyll transporter-like MFS transporter
MGLWGAAQAVAFGLGGVFGTGASDLARWALGTPAAAYATVFAVEALLFVLAAVLASRVERAAGPGASFRNGPRAAHATDASGLHNAATALGQPR